MVEASEKLPAYPVESIYQNQARLLGERLSAAFGKLREQRERLAELGLRPRIGLLADGDKIENQQIDIIDAEDEGRLELNFKLTDGHWKVILDKMKELAMKGQASKGIIRYSSKDGKTAHDLCEAFEIRYDGMTVRIATGINVRPQEVDLSHNDVQSALGLVQIEVPRNEEEFIPQEVGLKMNKLLVELLEIPKGLTTPDSVVGKKYKWARYAWHHKLTEQPEDWSGIEAKLTREEVLPGYFTFVERDKHKEYEAISSHAVFHNFDPELLPKIIKSGGLLSTHEKYRRGLLSNGTSSIADLETGSADNVFTHMVTEDGCRTLENDPLLAPYQKDLRISKLSSLIVFESDLLDRTDWYAFPYDVYGSTRSDSMSWRQSPREAIQNPTEKGFKYSNEQMFRLGIPIKKIKAIVCRQDLSWQEEAREWFSYYKIKKVGEKDIETILQEGVEATQKAFSKARSEGRIGRVPPPSSPLLTEEVMDQRLRGDSRDRVLDALRQAGITEINGKPIEEFVVYAENYDDLIDIAHGEEPRSARRKQERKTT